MRNQIKKIIFSFIILAFTAVVFPGFVSAQIPRPGNGLSLALDPQFPRANQEVNAKIENYVIDLNRVEVSWYIDGILKKEGFGEKEFIFTTGEVGSSSVITVKAKTATGEISKTFTIKPADVDIVWEAKSLTPPFYKGKALNSHETPVKIVAIPNFIIGGKKIKPESLIYTWRIGSRVLGNDSGYGKNVLNITGPKMLREDFVVLRVESLDKTLVAQKTLRIKTYYPKIIFYENNPLTGIFYKNAITNTFNMNKDELSVVSFPYFFSLNSKNSPKLKYRWTMNGNKISSANSGDSVTLRKDGGVKGVSRISLEAQNTENKMGLQFAKDSFIIKFD